MESKSFQIAISLRLGCKICHIHQCICGETVDSYGHHPLSCTKSQGRFSRHSSVINIIRRSFVSCNVPSILEPSDISRMDGKRPDGLTLIPWSHGKSLVWDFTCIDTLASSHLQSSLQSAGSTAEIAAKNKRRKYENLTSLSRSQQRHLVHYVKKLKILFFNWVAAFFPYPEILDVPTSFDRE